MGYKKLKDYERVVFLGLSVDSLYNEEQLVNSDTAYRTKHCPIIANY